MSSPFAIGMLALGLGLPALLGGGAPRAGAPALEGSCLRCHQPIQERIELPVQHEPAYEEDCTLCHSPHAARFPHLLRARERALCFTCHRDQRLAFQTGSVHTPVREGRCVACHEVHGSTHQGLLVAESNELCFSCHAEKQAETRAPVVHEPFVESECTDCHAAHNSPNEDQLVAPPRALCTLCHDVSDAGLVERHSGIPIAGTRCTECHDAHASASDGLLRRVTHQPFADGDCDMCHLLDSGKPQLVRATGARLCLTCHKDYPRASDAFVHRPVGDGNCGACHAPHASENDRLLLADARTSCLACHAELEKRARDARSAHPLSFDDGQSCMACHRPHSSPEEHLLNAGAIRTCLVCHETERHGHPLGDDRIDPRTGKGITCVTCHDPHGTEFSYQLRGDQSRGLCLQCHSADASHVQGGGAR